MRRLSLAVVLVLVMSSAANASIIYVLVSESPSGPNFNWFYNANLSADQKIDTVTPGVAQPAFTTIFDFPGAVSATSVPLVAGISTATVTQPTSAHAFNQNSTDSAAIPNVHTDITGMYTPSALTPIFQVTVTSIFGPPVVFPGELQEGQALKNAPGTASNNSLVGDTAQIEGPSGRVPEAGTLLLIGTGLIGLTGFARRRR